MLHAFNQKNVRRVLELKADEHVNDKNEDAITSMVFSPLSFMPPSSALQVLTSIVGNSLASAVDDREPVAHDPQLWPSGLEAKAWRGDDESRCEPDFIDLFKFQYGPPVLLIGEMKWDWRVKSGHLKQETDRQRRALSATMPDALQVVVTITKFRLIDVMENITQRTWVQVHQVARELAVRAPSTPEGRWGELVCRFLEKAEQLAFQGFHENDFKVMALTPTIFWMD